MKGIVASADPKIALADPAFIERIHASGVLKKGAAFAASSGVSSSHILSQEIEPAAESYPASASTTSAFLCTSGTTGRSKPCILPHSLFLQSATTMVNYLGLRSFDVLYCLFSLFHIDAPALTVGRPCSSVPLEGSPLAIVPATLGIRFGRLVRRSTNSWVQLLHSLTSTPSPEDRNQSVRLAWGVMVPTWAPQYDTRFGHPLFEVNGSSETSLPAI